MRKTPCTIGSPSERMGALLSDCARSLIRKKENLSPVEWVEKYVVLSKLSSSIPGPYRFDQVPALRWITDQMGNPEIRQITLLKSVQFGGTGLMINFLLLGIARGKPLLYVGQTETDVKKFLRAKFDPVEKNCRPVSELKSTKKTEWNVKLYDGCILDIGWGSSVNSLASSSKPWVARDEIDKWKQSDKSDIHAVEAAEERTTAFPDDSLILDTCTPTVEEGPIYQLYLRGSQHELHVKCPKCGHRQGLEWSLTRVVWPDDCTNQDGEIDMDRAMEEARIVCVNEECGAHLDEDDRLEMLKDLVPVATNPLAPSSHISLRVSALYSRFMSLPKIVKRFIEGRKTPMGMRAFYTQVLGLPFKPEAITNDAETIKELQARSPDYLRASRKLGKENAYELPFRPWFITTTVDVQGDHYWILQCAFDREGNCAVLDWEKIYSCKEARVWAKERFYSHEGDVMRSRFNFVDSGHRAKAVGGVYQFVIESRRHAGAAFLPCVGRNRDNMEMVQETDAKYRGIMFKLYSFFDPYFKELLYQHRMRSYSKEQLWLPKVLDNELVNQLTDERLMEKREPDGNTKMIWESDKGNNHLGDCLKMTMVIWERMAASLKEKEGVK